MEKDAYVIVRSSGAGCWAGNLHSKHDNSVVLKNARRLWYWSGAASLSELAMRGVAFPEKCKFPIAVTEVEIWNVLEVLSTTKEAEKNITEVPIWTIEK